MWSSRQVEREPWKMKLRTLAARCRKCLNVLEVNAPMYGAYDF